MPVVAAIVAIAAIVWGLVYARRGSITIGCALFVIVGYVLGHEFWHANVGPLPLTLDRALLVSVIGAAVIQWRVGGLQLKPLVGSDWLLGGLLLILTTSAVIAGPPEIAGYEGSVRGRLMFSFVVPALLYWIARQAAPARREWQAVLMAFVLLGTYLGTTAVLEIAGQWSLVFPRYISNPALGIHFGRARGPGLNAASLGIFLTACIWCGWILVGQARQRWQQLAILLTIPLMTLGVFFTYTRSTWLGLAASGLVVAMLEIPRRWRLPALSAAAVGSVLVVALSWSYVVGLEREGSGAESHHSVDQRQSFAYVSWQMFQDHPIFGMGFGRFYDRKLPYLSDRRQEVELESIRSLHHHNTLLSLLTETGMVGLAAFLAVLVVWGRYAWQLAENREIAVWMRGAGVLMLAILVNYMSSAAFHDLTLVPPQQCLLFLFAGLTANVWQQVGTAQRVVVTAQRKHSSHIRGGTSLSLGEACGMSGN